jgi:hypothetical protein
MCTVTFVDFHYTNLDGEVYVEGMTRIQQHAGQRRRSMSQVIEWLRGFYPRRTAKLQRELQKAHLAVDRATIALKTAKINQATVVASLAEVADKMKEKQERLRRDIASLRSMGADAGISEPELRKIEEEFLSDN